MDDRIEQAQIRIGRRFNDPELVRRALTHASIADTRRDSNERLEFLGDSVLGLVCCERIYSLYPDLLEGEMTKIKSTVVSRQTCAALAKQLSLEDLLILGKGMAVHKVLPSSLGAALIESLVGAMYLDGGLDAVWQALRPGGFFISKTPCVAEMNPLIPWVALPLARALGLAPPVHCFQGPTLEAAIARHGFEVLAVERHATKGRDVRPYIVARKPHQAATVADPAPAPH